ncbi:MAG TPA: hypothetical protein VGM19_00735 [Armatimonadota bacterium]|jgi:hypothetical protein
MQFFRSFVCVALLCAAVVVHAGGVQYLGALTAPRAVTPVVVDGNLQEWSGSAPLFLYTPLKLGEGISAESGAALTKYAGSLGQRVEVRSVYDDQALYLALTWQDPLLTKGGAGLGLNVLTDKLTHLDCQGGSAIEQMQMKLAGSSSPLPAGATLILPWSLVTPGGQAPAAGDKWPAVLQMWWAGLDSRFAVSTEIKLGRPGALSVPYLLPQDGEASLGVFDPAGRLVRWLLQADFRRAGQNVEPWDGLDNFGKPVAPGSYEVRGAYHPPLKLDYQMTATNPGHPGWPTTDGKGDWLSDESNPQAAVTDGNWIYLAAPGCEKGWSVIAVDESGQRQWGFRLEIYPRCISLALAGDYLYALVSGPELTDNSRLYKSGDNAVERALLLCLDKRTGQYVSFSAAAGPQKIGTWPYRHQQFKLWDLRAAMDYRPATYAGQPRYFDIDVAETSQATGLAALGDRLYVSLFFDGKLMVLDRATGKSVDEIAVPAPFGLSPGPEDSLLAVSEARIVRVNPGTKTVTPLITANLEAPAEVTVGPGGEIFVSDWGKSFQVKVFSPEGKFLRAVGKPGGRPWLGKYDPTGMLVPRGIAVTPAGRLWVAEDDSSPKRISVWDSRTGAFVREFCGPTPYGGGSFVPSRQSITDLISLGDRWRLDLAAKTFTPVATVSRRMSLDQPYAMAGGSGLSRLLGVLPRTKDGKEYLIGDNQHYGLTIFQRQGDLLVPVSAVGTLQRLSFQDGQGTSFVSWDSDLGRHVQRNWFPELFRDKIGTDYAWADRNGDGLCSADEFIFRPAISRGENLGPDTVTEWMTGWGYGIGPDWSIYAAGFCRSEGAIYRLDVQGWTPGGAPIYDPNQAKLIIHMPSPNGPGNDLVSGMWVNSDNELFVCYAADTEFLKPELRGATPGVGCYDRDGNLKWMMAGPRDTATKAFWGNNVCGEADVPGLGKVMALWNWHHNFRPYLFTSDGLYLGTLLDTETRVGPEAAWSESYKALWQTDDGQVWFMNGANQDHHLFKLQGLEQGGRFTGQLTLTQAEVDRAAQYRAAPVEEVRAQPVIWVPQKRQALTVDGDLADWKLDEGVTLTGSAGRSARVALQRDNENLYLAYEVQDTTPLLNLGADWQRLFISGDCVDLMLSTNPAADPNRREAAPGDQRLLLGVYQGQPIAVLYRPAVPGSTSPVQFMATRIDQVIRLDQAEVKFTRQAASYTIEARVPLADLGLAPLPTKPLRGDVGVIYSDETGHDRVLRLYYYNQDTTMTADLTTEARLQPDQWGPMVLEGAEGPNLLSNSGFEEPLGQDWTKGWVVLDQQNGAEATLTAADSYSGKYSLLLRQTTPPLVPADNSKLTWEQYNQAVKGGYILLSQLVPVTPGKHYLVRFRYRGVGGLHEQRQAGPDRGYAALQVALFWQASPDGGKMVSAERVLNELRDRPQWTTAVGGGRNEEMLGQPFTAPEGAHSVQLRLALGCTAPNTPSAWLDDVELLEVP